MADTITSGSIASFFTPSQKILALTNQINSLKSALTSGKPALTTEQEGEVVVLSKQTTDYNTALQSIALAKTAITTAQSKLEAITNKMYSLQRMAAMAAGGASESSFLNTDFQSQFGDLGKLAISASTDAGNLLSGTAGIFVQTGIDDSPMSRMFLQSINVTGLITFGALANISIDSQDNANIAMAAFSSAMTTLTQGKISLATMASNLAKKEAELTQAQLGDSTKLASLTTVDKAQVKAQISRLSQQLSVYQSISALG